MLLNGRNCEIAGRHGDFRPVRCWEGSFVSCGVLGLKGVDVGFGGGWKLELCLLGTSNNLGVCERIAVGVDVDFVRCLEAISETEVPQPWALSTRARRIAACNYIRAADITGVFRRYIFVVESPSSRCAEERG